MGELKARLVADGRKHVPTENFPTILVVGATIAFKQWFCALMDVTTAFLHSEEIVSYLQCI